jgi:hypothetical protein
MKTFLLTLCIAALPTAVVAQSVPKDLTAARNSPERKAILAALRPTISREAGVPVTFVVEHLKVQNNWAFFRGITRAEAGGEVRWERSPAYKDLVKEGVFDGARTYALLKRVGGRWKRVVHVIGPTDVAWACWWKRYGAPRSIFDLAEDCR